MKKFLSLVLALVMVMSLFTMGTMASAADFTDDDSIDYVEAVDVISAIKVIDGYTDGSFKPADKLTRGAAAKIITNMVLGPSTASTLVATVAPFPDVPANHTFAAYIAYCAQNGIINGYGDGRFAPDGGLTGFAFLKMLLGALGYDGKIEGFTGSNWSIQVAKIADGIGLTDKVAENFSGTSLVDRQTACLFAFNTLKADLVEYNNRITANVGGVDVAIGGNNIAHSKIAQTQASQANASNIVNESEATANNRIVQFAEEYFPRLVRNNKNFRYNAEYADLVKDNAGVDAMGRPASKWTYNGEKIGTYTEDANVSYNGSVKLNQIYSDLGMSSTAAKVYIYLNGNVAASTTATKAVYKDDDPTKEITGYTTETYKDKDGKEVSASVSRGNDTQIKDLVTPAGLNKVGDGTIVEAYRNDLTNEVIISCQSVYGGKVASVHAANDKKDDFVRVDWGSTRDGGLGAPDTIADEDHNEYETTAFAEDDVVAFTYSEQPGSVGIKSMYKMESVTGSLTRYTMERNLTLGDTVYKYAKEYTFSNGIDKEEELSNRSSYVVYLDSNGYALWIEEDEFSPDAYAVILRITGENDNGKIVFSGYVEGEYYNTLGEKVDKSSVGTGAWDGNRARLLFSDGTTRTVDLDKAYTEKNINDGSDEKIAKDYEANQIIRWRLNDNGAYKLSKPSTANTLEPIYADVLGDAKGQGDGYLIHDRNVYGFSGKGKDGKDVEFDSKTLFVVNEYGEYVTYLGIRNAPDVQSPKDNKLTEGDVQAYIKDGVCKILFIRRGDVVGSSRNITFLAGPSITKVVKESDSDWYYTYNAVVKGQITTIDVAVKQKESLGSYGKSMLFDLVGASQASYVLNQTSYDDELLVWADFNVDSGATPIGNEGKTYGIKRNGNNEVRIGTANSDGESVGNGALHTLADNAKIYLIDKDGEIEEITYSQISTSNKTTVYAVKDDGDITYLFIVDKIVK